MPSLVTTVFNDKRGLEIFFEQIAVQTLLPDEIVIVDGGSTDGSWEFMQEQQPPEGVSLIVKQEKGCNVAQGRNLAIAIASGDIIVSTDIGCRWDKEWFAELVQPMFNDPNVDVVIGSWGVRPEDLESDWARTEYAYRGGLKLQATPESLGISRSIAYKKTVWEKIDGYPEDLTLACDDVVYNKQLKQMKFKSAAAPKIRCYWLRHKTLKQFCKEEWRNFLGAGEAAIWQKHFVLVTGRILLELFSLIIGIVILLVTSDTKIGVLFVIVGTVSVMQRLLRLRNAATQLIMMNVPYPWFKLIVFEYMTKLYGMIGYARGFMGGLSQCQQCRQRLKSV